MPKTRLKNLVVKEISTVDRGANQGATVEFWKKDQMNTGDNTMDVDLEQTIKKVDDLEKANARLENIAKMTDAQKSFADALEGEAKEDFIKMSAKDKLKLMEEAKVKEEKMKLKKQEAEEALGKQTSEALTKAEISLQQEVAKREALEARIEKMEKEATFNSFIAEVQKRVPSLASKEKETLAKSLFAMDEDTREITLKSLESAEKVKKDFLLEKGSSASDIDTDPEAKLDKMAKSYQEKNDGVSYADALEEVSKSAEGKELYKQTLPKAN